MGNLISMSTTYPSDDYEVAGNTYDYPTDNKNILHKIKATNEQIYKLKSNVKHLDQIINVYRKVIIGGSRALKLWTEREFYVDDNDIFLHSIKGNRHNGKLEKDVEQLMRIFPNCSIRVQLSKDTNKSIVNEEQETEEFDQAIIGTINLKYEGNKYQFVMIEQNPGFTYSLDLIGWYGRTTDLPVFILYDKFEMVPHFIIKHGFGHLLAKQGVLFELRHENRIKKYEEKGFKFINFADKQNILSEETLYDSSIDMIKYNS